MSAERWMLAGLIHRINPKPTHFGWVSYYVYERAHEILTQPWGFPFSNMRPHTFSPPPTFKVKPGESPGHVRTRRVWQGEGRKGIEKVSFFVFTFDPLKTSFCLRIRTLLQKALTTKCQGPFIYSFNKYVSSTYWLLSTGADTVQRIVSTNRVRRWG